MGQIDSVDDDFRDKSHDTFLFPLEGYEVAMLWTIREGLITGKSI